MDWVVRERGSKAFYARSLRRFMHDRVVRETLRLVFEVRHNIREWEGRIVSWGRAPNIDALHCHSLAREDRI